MNKLAKWLDTIIVVFFAVLVLLTFAQVLSRYVFDFSFAWTEEISRYLFVWMVFVGAALGFRYGSHIALDLVIKYLPNWGKKIAQWLNVAGVVIFSGTLIYYGWKATLVTMRQFSPAMHLPMGYIYAAIPIGAIFTIVFIIESLFRAPAHEGGEESSCC